MKKRGSTSSPVHSKRVKESSMAESKDRRRILIKGGTVVNATHMEKADVFCEDGLIRAVGEIGTKLPLQQK